MATVQFRTDETTKKQSAAVFKHLGITMSDAINLFLRQSILHGGLPFDIKIPNYNDITFSASGEMEQDKRKDVRGNYANFAPDDIKVADAAVQINQKIKLGFVKGPPLPDSFFDPLPEEELQKWEL